MNDLQEMKNMLRTFITQKQQTNDTAMREKMMQTIGKDLVAALTPLLKEMGGSNKSLVEDLKQAIREIKIESPQLEMPEINIPDIIMPDFPEIHIPTPVVNYTPPAIYVPKIVMPKEMDIKGWVKFQGYDLSFNSNPLPVQIRDSKGNELNFNALLAAISARSGGNGGGSLGSAKMDFFTIQGINSTVGAAIVDSSGVQYSTSNPLPVVVTSGGGGSTAAALIDSSGAQYSGSNPLPVTIASASGTTASNIVDSSAVAYSGSNPFPVTLALGSNATVAAINVDSSGVGYSGSNPLPIVIAAGSNNSVAAAMVDSSGVEYSGSNPLPITIALGSNSTVAAINVDSSGVGYSGSNPLPVTLISGALTSTIAAGAVVAGAADDGSAPLKTGGIARTANPGAVTGGQTVSSSYDKIGRQVMRTVQVRDLIQTAYATLTTGTETTLRAGVAGAYLDLIYVLGSNNSDVAVTVDIRPVTAGNIVITLQIPASGTAGVSLPVPLPQTDTGNNWTADMGDITGTTVYLSALFSQEI